MSALGGAERIVNIGAGAASYEPGDRDLDDGTWARRNGHLLDTTELDLGCRLVIGERR